MFRCMLFPLLFLMPLSVAAGPDRYSFLLGSHHLNATSDFNEFNPGVFATWGERQTFSLGIYENSYSETSIAAMYHYPLTPADHQWQLSAFGGVANYPNDGRRFVSNLFGDVIVLAGVQVQRGNFFVQAIPCYCGAVDIIFRKEMAAAGPVSDVPRPCNIQCASAV